MTVEEPLSLIFGKPLFEQGETGVADIDQDVADLGIDKRMGVTKEWSAYLKRLDHIKNIHHKAKKYGLDQEFREILQSAIGDRIRELSKQKPINPREAIKIVGAIARSGFELTLNKRASDLKRPRKPKATGKSRQAQAFNKAVEVLKQDGGEGSISRLVNPRGIDTSKRQVFDLGDAGKFDLDPTRRNLGEMVKELTSKMENTGREDLAMKMQKGFAARSLIFQSVSGMEEDQARYTSMLYSLYNIAKEFEDEMRQDEQEYELQGASVWNAE